MKLTTPVKHLKNDRPKAALIYNPHAGEKRRMIPSRAARVTLEDIKTLLNQYQIPVDYFPTKYSGHATKLAQEAAKKGYKLILAAGGDGTVGEVANGLVNSDATLGIIPLGSFMNVARMLSISTEIEKAIALIKIGRTRKIDLGMVLQLNGKDLSKPYFFMESAGLGLEAELHQYVHELEQGQLGAVKKIFKSYFEYYGRKATLIFDQQEIKTKAIIISISNGPYTGAGIPIAPKAKLNDHLLTITLFKMTKWELVNYFFKLIQSKRRYTPKVVTYQARQVEIQTKIPRSVHADARIYGQTPIKLSILPNALNVITGFPKLNETSALLKRTYLD